MSEWKPQFGWLGPEAADKAWDDPFLRQHFVPYPVRAMSEYKRFAPWDKAIEIATGQKFLKQYRQEAGSCVAHGAKNAVEHLSCIEIALLGDQEEFHYIFPPYYYAIGRMAPEGGNGQLGNSEGSLGSWMSATVKVHGTLFSDDKGVPPYSGSVDRTWGTSRTIWKQYEPTAIDNLVNGIARITSGEMLRDALCNGYMCTIASNVGYSMRLQDHDGKSWFVGRDSWSHQMSYLAYAPKGDTGNHDDAVFLMNSWGTKAHGPQLDGPDGGGWITLEKADATIRSAGAECFAYSRFDGFPAREPDFHFLPRS